MLRILLLIIGYFIGNIETGYIFGKIHKMDIRNYGSGNAGATNKPAWLYFWEIFVSH